MDRETLEKAYQAALDAAARQLSYRGLSTKALREKLMQKEIGRASCRERVFWWG